VEWAAWTIDPKTPKNFGAAKPETTNESQQPDSKGSGCFAFVSIPDFRGRTAEQIVTEPFISDSAWHIHAALSWADYVKRTSAAIGLHYAGFHLRLGIEHLWFQIFWAGRGGGLPVEEYKKAIKTATKLYKLIDSLAPDYRKFAEFDQIIASVDSRVHPATIVWDIDRLKRIHGECGTRLLHFQGLADGNYLSDKWMIQQLAFLEENATWIWNTMRSRGNLVVYRPKDLFPQTQLVWESYRKGEIDEESVRYRLEIIRPLARRQ